MTKEERAEWVRRGYTDPMRAYAQHAARATAKGIGFELTFAEWWGYWRDHYEKRGREVGCMVMCRTGDVGPYAVGNVRIGTVRENAQERSLEYRVKNGLKDSRKHNPPPAHGSWLWRRNVFSQYIEEEDEETA